MAIAGFCLVVRGRFAAITLLAWWEAWTVAAGMPAARELEAGKVLENGGLTTEIHGKW